MRVMSPNKMDSLVQNEGAAILGQAHGRGRVLHPTPSLGEWGAGSEEQVREARNHLQDTLTAQRGLS